MALRRRMVTGCRDTTTRHQMRRRREYSVHGREDPRQTTSTGRDLGQWSQVWYVPTLDWLGYVVSTILLPQFPFVCSNVLRGTASSSSFFSSAADGNENASASRDGLSGTSGFFPEDTLPGSSACGIAAVGRETVEGGEEDKASCGVILRMELDERIRGGGSIAAKSNLDCTDERTFCVED
jgi:hypothetical protein